VAFLGERITGVPLQVEQAILDREIWLYEIASSVLLHWTRHQADILGTVFIYAELYDPRRSGPRGTETDRRTVNPF
jgi:hypothetical protein